MQIHSRAATSKWLVHVRELLGYTTSELPCVILVIVTSRCKYSGSGVACAGGEVAGWLLGASSSPLVLNDHRCLKCSSPGADVGRARERALK